MLSQSRRCVQLILSHSDHVLYASRVQIGHQTHSFIRCLHSQRCPPAGITMLQQANTLEFKAPGRKHTQTYTHKCFVSWVPFVSYSFFKSLFPVRTYPLTTLDDYEWSFHLYKSHIHDTVADLFIINILHVTPQNCFYLASGCR